MKPLRFRYAATLCAALSISVLALPAERATADGGTIVVANTAGPGTLDPHMAGNTIEIEAVNHIFEGILALDERYRPKPMLATGYQANADASVYTFALRHGVKFQNGKEMTSVDVKASFERYAKVSPNTALLADVASYDTPDPYTFVVHLKHPNPVFDVMVATPSYPLGILPADEAAKAANQISYIGTGPFKLGEWVRDGHLTLVRNDSYTPDMSATGTDGYAGKKIVAIDSLRYNFVPEANTRVSAVTTGDATVAEVIPPELAKNFDHSTTIGVGTVFPGCMSVVMIHSLSPPTDNVLVRQAIAAAINADDVMAGSGQIAKLNPSLLYADSAYYNQAEAAQFYNQNNVAKAKDLLKQAGYKNEKITILTNSTYAPMRDTSLVIGEQLKAAGMNANVEIVDAVTSFSRVNDEAKTWNLTSGWYCSQPILGPQQWRPYLYNQLHIKNDPTLDAAYTRFLTSPAVDDRKAAWTDLEHRLLGDQTYVIKVFDFGTQYAYSQRVKGLQPWYGLRFWNVTLQ